MLKQISKMNVILFFIILSCVKSDSESEEPILYYYGIEESERGLPACGEGQACSALLRRHWRPPALVRLCRCARRLRCDSLAEPDHLIEINNRAHLQFCQPVKNWPECSITDNPLTIEMKYDRMNPDELEEIHHQNIQLTPPKIVLTCLCRSPNYWKLKTKHNSTYLSYQCRSLPRCETGEFCGNVSNDLYHLYQSCTCPKNHMCVHNGGITYLQISELLYRGAGWRAYCQPISEDYSYEDYLF